MKVSVNKKLYEQMLNEIRNLEKTNERQVAVLRKKMEENAPKSVIEELHAKMRATVNAHNILKADLTEYLNLYERATAQEKLYGNAMTGDISKFDYDLAVDRYIDLKEIEREFKKYESDLSEKYLDKKKKNDSKAKRVAKKVIKAVALLVTLGLAGLGVSSIVKGCAKDPVAQSQEDDKKSESKEQATPTSTSTPTSTPAPTATPTPTPVSTPESTLKLGEPGTFTDASDEEQIKARAQYIYDNFIKNDESKAKEFPLESIANDLRMINGEFKINESGNIEYNETDVIDTSKSIHSIANYDSIDNSNLKFTPTAFFFLDNSKAQEAAKIFDERMEKVVNAINADDKEAFVEAAKSWGEAVVYICEYVDFDPKYPNIWKTGNAEGFQLYHAMRSKYATTILEYSQAKHLDICIDYCIDYETGEVKQEALSEIMYRIDEKMIDAVAVRSGNLEEYVANNLSLPEHLCVMAKDYFRSKYDLEIGIAPKLK